MVKEKGSTGVIEGSLWIRIQDNLPVIVVVLITILIGIAIGIVGKWPQLLNSILTGGMWALLSVGLALVFGVMNIPHFAHGESFMVGAYVAYFVFTPLNNYLQQNPNQLLAVVSPLIAIFAAGIAGFILGVILERLLFYPLRLRSKPGEWVMNAFLLTVGISFVLINTVKLTPFLGNDFYGLSGGYWKVDTINVYPQAKSEDALEGLDNELYQPILDYLTSQEGSVTLGQVVSEFGATREDLEKLAERRIISFGSDDPLKRLIGVQGLTTERAASFLISILCIGALWFFLRQTRTGRAIRAVSQDEVGAKMMGINLNFIFPLTFGIATAMASIAGGSLLFMFQAHPNVGLQPLYTAWFVVMMAGLGNVIGAVVGGFIVSILQTATQQFTYGALINVIPTIIMIIVLLVVPSGIFGSEVKGIQEQ
ncbi:MAG: branched-chain amino acid ABC transporter permease [Anaerolineales bacterium]